MPGRNPTDEELRAAERIVLVDPRHPGWERPLYVRLILRGLSTIEIPVDSTDNAAIEAWRRHIEALGLDD